MRQIAFLLCAFLFVTACGGKRVQVVPAGPATATSTARASSTPLPPATPPAPTRSAPAPSAAPVTPIPPPPATPPAAAASEELEGLASYYAEPYHGRRTANGEVFDTYQAMTAAHRTLPFNTVVKVTNTSNGKEVEVRINDRGPFIEGRVIDLSLVAARQIDMVGPGIVPVTLEILSPGVSATRPPGSVELYAVQVGAFENLGAAEDLKRRLESKYPEVTVATSSGDKTIHRVRIGRGLDILAAHQLAQQLRDEGVDSFVVRLN